MAGHHSVRQGFGRGKKSHDTTLNWRKFRSSRINRKVHDEQNDVHTDGNQKCHCQSAKMSASHMLDECNQM